METKEKKGNYTDFFAANYHVTRLEKFLMYWEWHELLYFLYRHFFKKSLHLKHMFTL
jgi:hypothetical protein